MGEPLFKTEKQKMDNSDMQLWATHACSYQFFSEVEKEIEAGIRALIKNPTHENAEKVKAFQKIVSLIEEARSIK